MPDTIENIIKSATVKDRALWHINLTEAIDSKEQRDWTGLYGASFRLTAPGAQEQTFGGSTLPNSLPEKDNMPPDWEYSVVMATCAFPGELRNRFYRWRRIERPNNKGPALRFLSTQTPTVAVGSTRQADKFLDWLRKRSTARSYQYATDILVHRGYNTERGSEGCLTIKPGDHQKFFAAIPLDTEGTLALNRGIHDQQVGQSYCY